VNQIEADHQPASDAAELVLDFVNTRPNGNGQPELLADRAAFARWLEDRGLLADPEGVTNADAVAARELRESLAALLRAHVGTAEADEADAAESHLRRTAERFPLVPVISAEGTRLVPAQGGVPGAFATILAAVTDAAARGQWRRMKMCRNAPCHASFLDKTRNSAGLYCSAACSSQMAMRAYRGRLKST
jgi:predicted RNA-binding Zn ribbon-like protein